MEIGNQIKALRVRKGVTQKQMAQHFGITEQAISKWGNNASVPDIAMPRTRKVWIPIPG